MSNVKFMTKKELAGYFRTSVSWVDKAMIYEPEKLPAFIRVGRLIRFPIEEIMKFEQQQLTNTK